jgi:hypothetical protein
MDSQENKERLNQALEQDARCYATWKDVGRIVQDIKNPYHIWEQTRINRA